MIALVLLAGAALPALLVPDPRCRKNNEDEIVVCGSREEADEQFRLRPLPDKYVQSYDVTIKLPGGASLSPKAESGRLNDPRAMVTLKVPF